MTNKNHSTVAKAQAAERLAEAKRRAALIETADIATLMGLFAEEREVQMMRTLGETLCELGKGLRHGVTAQFEALANEQAKAYAKQRAQLIAAEMENRKTRAVWLADFKKTTLHCALHEPVAGHCSHD
jgi:hypothetical protein